jgi:DNA-directed RNA polymerase beta subunit
MDTTDTDKIIDKIVAVPPIIKRTEALEFADPRAPGKITIDEHGKLLKTYFELETKLGSHIETYDMWVTTGIKYQLASRKLTTPRGDVTISNPIFIPPSYTDTVGTKIPLTPKLARDNGYTYAAEIYVDFILNAGTPQEERLTNRFFGKIPVMLGSVLCHTRNKTDRELIAMGECPYDPKGYFIIKGNEKVILTQEKLRVNRIFIYNSTSKGDIVCKMTCATILGSTNVTMVQNKKTGSLEIHLPFMGRSDQTIGKIGNTMAVFQLYRMLGVTDNRKMLEMISAFTKRENIKKIWVQLQPTFMELAQIGDDIEYIAGKKGLGDMDPAIKRSTIMTSLQNELFPHISANNIRQKLYMLSVMVARFSEVLIGVRELDDRDHWGNKRLESAGRSMEQLFGNIYKEMIIKAQDSIDEGRQTLQAIYRSVDSSMITDNFVSSFAANAWGVQGSFMAKENITDALKRDSQLSLYSHLMKINTPTSRKAKQSKIRLVQMSQLGYICPVESPEGQQCGLVKNASITLYISLDRNEDVITDRIAKYISDVPTDTHTTPYILNGRFMGWCTGPELKAYCVQMRRSGVFHKDVCIVMHRDNFLYIYTDGSRPTRPLLIVDPTSNKLVIDIKDLWNADMRTLLSQGCVEYIDSFEQEYTYIAQSINDLKTNEAELNAAITEHQKEIQKLAELEAKIPDTVEGFPMMELEETINKVKQAVGLAFNTMKELQDLPPYTHCELDPTAIMGIAASIIPLANHNQGPRLSYQCLSADTPVIKSDMSRVPIKDLRDGDTVITINPITLKKTETTIHSHFVIDSREAGKEMYEIETHSGRLIQATGDHKFLTLHGWVEADKLDMTKHHLGIHLLEQNDNIFVPIKSIKKIEGRLVSDFTTTSDNHSFVSGNGFITHNCGMGKQSLGIYSSQHHNRFDTTAKCLAYPSPSLFETQMNEELGLNEIPAGTTVILAIMTYTGFTQEDAIIMNRSSIDRGLFRQMIYKSYKSIQKRTRYTTEIFGRPELRAGERAEKYAALDERGIARVGAQVREGDCIIGKIRKNLTTGKNENASEYVGVGMEGVVESVIEGLNPERMKVVKVKIRQVRKPVMGDKFASRHAQKTTVGLILPEEDMPYTANGIKPDIIINPHSIPSRMTIAKLIEIVASKVSAFTGERVNATAFRKFDIDEFKRNLKQYGYAPGGKEAVFSGFTGEKMEAEIFMGPCYYQALRHQVKDKIQMRSMGAIKQLSHQPLGGRAQKGGQRFGEMERDAIISHGASEFLKERLCGVSDPYKSVRCIECGKTPTVNPNSDKYVCDRCGPKAEFGVCTHPYAFKLLEQTLAGAGIQIELGFKKIVKKDEPNKFVEAPQTNINNPFLPALTPLSPSPPQPITEEINTKPATLTPFKLCPLPTKQ